MFHVKHIFSVFLYFAFKNTFVLVVLLVHIIYSMIPGSKDLSPHELAHKWVKDLGTRPDMSIKVGCISHDMRILGRIVGVRSTEQSVGIIVGGF